MAAASFDGYDVRPVEGYAQDLLDVLRAVGAARSGRRADRGAAHAGVYNSAYFEHAFLAKGMGIADGRGLGPVRRRRHGLHAHDPRAASAWT